MTTTHGHETERKSMKKCGAPCESHRNGERVASSTNSFKMCCAGAQGPNA